VCGVLGGKVSKRNTNVNKNCNILLHAERLRNCEESLKFHPFLGRIHQHAFKGQPLLLEVDNLNVRVCHGNETLKLLTGITFSLDAAEVFALVGESGCGKTTLARALTNLFPQPVDVLTEGSVWFDGRDLLSFSEDQLRLIRREEIRYVFQEPASALNPALRIGTQIRIASGSNPAREPGSIALADDSISHALQVMGITEPERLMTAYPHQLSVGTLQRLLIALAIAPRPKLLIADEPTSAVDAILRTQILDLLVDYCRTHGMALLLITHDLSLAQRHGQRVAVLYAGRIVEVARSEAFFESPLHPYSQLLLASTATKESTLETMPTTGGSVPSFSQLPDGCKFHPRCPKVQPDCMAHEPELQIVQHLRQVRCPYWK
jgi:oligopeptide/dipeptide ABC transporter ATP-binding protein